MRGCEGWEEGGKRWEEAGKGSGKKEARAELGAAKW